MVWALQRMAQSGDEGARGAVMRGTWVLIMLAACAHAQFPFGSTMEGSEQLEAYIGVQCAGTHEPCRHVVDVRSLYKHTHPGFPDQRLALGPHAYISLSIAAKDAQGNYSVLLHQVCSLHLLFCLPRAPVLFPSALMLLSLPSCVQSLCPALFPEQTPWRLLWRGRESVGANSLIWACNYSMRRR